MFNDAVFKSLTGTSPGVLILFKVDEVLEKKISTFGHRVHAAAVPHDVQVKFALQFYVACLESQTKLQACGLREPRAFFTARSRTHHMVDKVRILRYVVLPWLWANVSRKNHVFVQYGAPCQLAKKARSSWPSTFLTFGQQTSGQPGHQTSMFWTTTFGVFSIPKPVQSLMAESRL